MSVATEFDGYINISTAAKKFRRSMMTIRRAIRRAGVVPVTIPGLNGKLLSPDDIKLIRKDLTRRKPSG